MAVRLVSRACFERASACFDGGRSTPSHSCMCEETGAVRLGVSLCVGYLLLCGVLSEIVTVCSLPPLSLSLPYARKSTPASDLEKQLARPFRHGSWDATLMCLFEAQPYFDRQPATVTWRGTRLRRLPYTIGLVFCCAPVADARGATPPRC